MVMCTRLGLCIASRGVVYDTGRCGGWVIITKGWNGRYVCLDVVFILLLWVLLVVVSDGLGLCRVVRGFVYGVRRCRGWTVRAEVWVGKLSR